tara:strand:+ start:5128 stop:5577 length:450 start_codon:yes stop_codon:yes gene_type:complete
MILISHRGNICGPNREKENTLEYIQKALDLGFDVEIDVWGRSQLWLGHDKPEHPCPLKFLVKNFRKLWIHCKNLEAISILSELKVLNYFWHQEDDFSLTSKNFIWTYPGKRVCNRSVLVVDDATNYAGQICFGLCSDYIRKNNEQVEPS